VFAVFSVDKRRVRQIAWSGGKHCRNGAAALVPTSWSSAKLRPAECFCNRNWTPGKLSAPLLFEVPKTDHARRQRTVVRPLKLNKRLIVAKLADRRTPAAQNNALAALPTPIR